MFTLSPFQKEAISAIENGDHVLITAHTGSGKTLPAQHAIEYFTKQNKKVIYTSPIKALSNQKYSDFLKQYTHLEVGILTGDNKHNPDGNLLIMTTEILQNQLLRQNSDTTSYLDFNIDIHNELGCVIFDEVHYINNEDRGTIWEQTMMLLPNHVQMVMLSATIGNPDYLTNWIEKIKEKKVVVCGTNERVVPLEYYQYFTCSNKDIQHLPKDHQNKIIKNQDKLTLINDESMRNNEHCMKYLKQINISRKYVLNELCKKLREYEMFPALFFVFSRKQVELIANEITFPLFEENEKDYNVRPICKQLLVSRVSNWKEYIILPEYEHYVSLLEKGIGLHHAGMLPIFREMIEILYEKKYIKVLFATETFAIGLNMPTKTVCFTNVYKHDGKEHRMLYNNEFKQMCGRAGRRNIDKIGYVILLTNLFYEKPNYNELLSNKENNIKSRLKINYSYLLHNLNHFTKEENIDFIKKSLMYCDIEKVILNTKKNIEKINESVSSFQIENIEYYDKYIKIKNELSMANNKKKKQIMKELKTLEPYITHMDVYNEYNNLKNNIIKEKNYLYYAETFISSQVESIYIIFENNNFICENKISEKGKIACMMNEIHPLVFSDLYEKTNGFIHYDYIQLYSLLSCFYELKNKDYPVIQEEDIYYINEKMNYYQDCEIQNKLSSMNAYNLQYAMYNYIKQWIEQCDNEESALKFILYFKQESNLFIGDFVKCCLKLIHISHELETICEYLENYECLEKVKIGKEKIMKFIITNQSLYL